MERRSQKIISVGASYFDQILAEREEETLHLEFKTLSHEGGQLKRDDRKLVAAAITGMANAEGGLLIVGVETKRVDGIDVAISKRPIKQLQRTVNLIRAALPEMLSPQPTGIEIYAVEETGKTDEGFIVIDVLESSGRPHYSNVHHQYFRRGSDGTRVMEHGEIRDLMFATREGLLEISCGLRMSSSTGDLKYSLQLVLALRNVGSVPVRAPYLRLAEQDWHPASSDWVLPRFGVNRVGFYTTPDLIIHVEDEFGVATHPTGLDFRRTGQYQVEEAINTVKSGQWNRVVMKPLSKMGELGPVSDEIVRVSGSYGALNAAIKSFEMTVDKETLFDMFCREVSKK